MWDVIPDRRGASRAGGAGLSRATTTAWRFTPPMGRFTSRTTRPELIAACVALIAHPDDDRYRSLNRHTVTSPIFGVELPSWLTERLNRTRGRVWSCAARSAISQMSPGGVNCRCPPGSSSAAMAGSSPSSRAGSETLKPGLSWRARRRSAPEKRWWDCCSLPVILRAPYANPAQGQLLRTRRQAPGDRLYAPVVHPQRGRIRRSSGRCSLAASSWPGRRST